ncbi:hypothetical protein TIFTF001_036783 [Ficus carica]|uniref:Uncharacterized protein n=1 Tax=Ficus carica TaxID=3494 RepID=A0AA88EEJ8_FICCA|nr:hypothetical protein TIFTF001_036783 [Ficus carica]
MLGGIRIQLPPLVGTFQHLQARSWPSDQLISSPDREYEKLTSNWCVQCRVTQVCWISCTRPHQIPCELASSTNYVPPRVLPPEIL